MALMNRIREWFGREREKEREEELEQAEEALRDPSLRDAGDRLHQPGVQPGYTPADVEREP